MILIIDNFDSFVENLARYIREAGWLTVVIRNDDPEIEHLVEEQPAGVVISPGPKTPSQAGASKWVIRNLRPQTPLLGVCLGHQCLVEVFGGETARARAPLHGQATPIRHIKTGLYKGIPSPMRVGRYHSLISNLAEESELDATAWSAEGELMSVAHRTRPWFGVQFHPESLLTDNGRTLISNFLLHCRAGERR